jgi:thioredoxin-related protein
MKKTIVLWASSALLLFASVGEEIFDEHCASCHSYYLPMSQVIANAEQNNTILHLKAPTLNQLSYGMYLHVGDRKADEESQKLEVEDFIMTYVETPDRKKSVLSPKLTHFFPDMQPLEDALDEDQMELLSSFIFYYGRKMVEKHSVKNYKSFEEAKKVAKEEGKIIMIRGTLPFCKWCIKMDREVMVEPEVREVLNNSYVVTEVNVGIEKLPLGMTSLGTPSFYFIASDGKTVIDQVSGYGDMEEFLELLHMIKDEAQE